MKLFQRNVRHCAVDAWLSWGDGTLLIHIPLFLLRTEQSALRNALRTGWYVPFICVNMRKYLNTIRIDWGIRFYSKFEWAEEWTYER